MIEKLFENILREANSDRDSFKRKDGVYILSSGGVNADYNFIEVWKDGEMIEKTDNQYHTSKERYDSVFDEAQELADKYNLKIFDGTGVSWSVFSSRFHRNNNKDSSPYVKKGAEWVEYSDQDLDDMDTRPKVTTKWAVCTSPGKFDIYDNIQKNPEKYYDTDQFRGVAGSYGDRVGELKKFFDENADKIYQGTFDDIKDGQYTVVVNGRVYQSNNAGKMINDILNAGLDFDGKRVTGQVNFGARRNRNYDYYEDEIVEISCGPWSDESQLERLTQIYDVLTMVGIDVPNEFAFSSEDEPEYMVVVDSNKNLHHTSSSSYKNSRDLQVGDIVELDKVFPYEYSRYSGDSYYSPLFVVVETDGINAKLAQCSDVKLTYESRSLYDRNKYEVKFSQDKYDDALKGAYDKKEIENIDLLHTNYNVVTKKFRLSETFNKMEKNKLWENIYNKSNKKVKEARTRKPGRKDQMNPSIIIQEASIFFEDEGFTKLKYGTNPKPETFTVFERQGDISLAVAINGDYTDDILINAFFDSASGYGYVIQAHTLDGRIEWVGFDKSEFREDLEDALVNVKKLFEENRDKHTFETWLQQTLGEDKARDMIEKLHFMGDDDAHMEFLSRDEFEAKLADLNIGSFKESIDLREDADSERKEMQALFKKAAKKVKVKILDTYIKNKRHWSVTLDTENEYDARKFRYTIDDLLGENSGAHSYDDMEGLGTIHISIFEYYEYSDDDYRDLDPSIRDKYVVYCEPAERYKQRRQMDW